MDYAGRRTEDPAAAPLHHAAYASAHHHPNLNLNPNPNPNPNPLHQHPHHLNHNPQSQSHFSQYYPNPNPNPNPSSAPSYPSSNPSLAPELGGYPSAGPNFDGNPTPAAAAPAAAEPYVPNPYRGAYEGLRRAAATAADGPPTVDSYMPNPYVAHGGYGGHQAPANAADGPQMRDPYAVHGGYGGLPAPVRAADGPPMSDPYAAHGGYGGLPAPATPADGPPMRDPYAAYGGLLAPARAPARSMMDPYVAHGGYGGHPASAGSLVRSNVMEPYVPNPYPPPRGGYDGVHADAMRRPYLGFGPAGSGSYHYGGGGARFEQYGGNLRICGGGAQARSSNVLEPVPSHQIPEDWSDIIRPDSKEATRKNVKYTTKVVQTVYCQVCKIECSNKDTLDIHKQGKKHKKHLLKLQETITAKPATAPSTTVEKETPATDEGDNTASKQKKRAGPVSTEDLETKRKRLLESGAAADEIKECKICNVIVNSKKVFDYHIQGRMHITMVKQLQSETAAN